MLQGNKKWLRLLKFSWRILSIHWTILESLTSNDLSLLLLFCNENFQLYEAFLINYTLSEP